MLNKIKEKMFGKDNELLLQKVVEQLISIRQDHTTLVLYGYPTEGNWLGIANATKGLYPGNSLEIPQLYSNPVFNDKECGILCEEIDRQNFEKVIISGFAPYFFDWIELLSKHTFIEIIFHGTISEFHEKEKQNFIGNLIQFAKENKIKKLGFVKKGLAEVFQKLYGLNAYHQPLPFPIIPADIKKIELDRSKFHIGVFGADTFNKNIHNQVIHALMIDNTVVHVLDNSIFSYLAMGDRIVGHGNNLSRKAFLSVLGSMNINLYMSYNESWGLVAYESEAMGVPCLKTEELDYTSIINYKIEKQG